MVDLIYINKTLVAALEGLVDACEGVQDWDGTRVGEMLENAKCVLWGTPEEGRIDLVPTIPVELVRRDPEEAYEKIKRDLKDKTELDDDTIEKLARANSPKEKE